MCRKLSFGLNGAAFGLTMAREACPAAPGLAENDWQFVAPGQNRAHDLEFTGVPGWRNMEDDRETVSDYCDTFLTLELFEKLAKWVNSRATIHKAQVYMENDEVYDFTETSANEMRKFIGLSFLMGILKKPYIKHYWSTKPMLSTPYFHNACPETGNISICCVCAQCIVCCIVMLYCNVFFFRYCILLKFLRFSNPYEVDSTKRSTRMNGIDDLMMEICSQFCPGQELSLDESLLLYKGRLNFKQFIRIKRARFGIKIFILTDMYGYILSYITYYGAATEMACPDNDFDHLKPSERVVVVLLSRSGLLDKGYIVTVDNWYLSV